MALGPRGHLLPVRAVERVVHRPLGCRGVRICVVKEQGPVVACEASRAPPTVSCRGTVAIAPVKVCASGAGSAASACLGRSTTSAACANGSASSSSSSPSSQGHCSGSSPSRSISLHVVGGACRHSRSVGGRRPPRVQGNARRAGIRSAVPLRRRRLRPTLARRRVALALPSGDGSCPSTPPQSASSTAFCTTASSWSPTASRSA